MSPQSPNADGAYSRRQILTIFSGIMAGMSLASLDGTAVNTALATMVADLGGLSAYAWIGTSYLLTSTVANALFGKLSDIYGRKRLFQIAIITFLEMWHRGFSKHPGAGHVDIKCFLKDFISQCIKVVMSDEFCPSSIVDQDVELAKLFERFVNESLTRCLVADVGLHIDGILTK